MPDRTNPQNRRLLIRGALVIDPSQNSEELRDLLVAGGRIAALADETDLDGAEVIEAEGLVCAPGLVDMHVHLRDPGQTYKEDLESGCQAARRPGHGGDGAALFHLYGRGAPQPGCGFPHEPAAAHGG